MAFCRWSSDGWRCDVYCYESEEGFVTHVARKRHVGLETLPPEPDVMELNAPGCDCEDWAARYNAYQDALQALPLVDIGLPHDGATFVDETLAGLRERLIVLRDEGYIVPPWVFHELDAELAEASQAVPGGGGESCAS